MKTNKTSHKKFTALRGLAKRIFTILLAGAMVFPVALSASACRVTITDNGDGTFNIDPANPNDKDNTGSSQGNTNTPQDNQTTPKEPDYSKYSPLLQEVLNDPEYDELYRMYKSNELYEASSHVDIGTNLLEAISYDFLASKNEDIDGIKKGAVSVGANLYIVENENFYIYSKLNVGYGVENGENYIHQYLLQYKITEQELKDLTMLYNGRYFQGPVMFQHLASKQTPKVIEEFSIEEKTYIGLLSCLNNQKSIRDSVGLSSVSSFIVKELETEPINDQLNYYLTIDMISDTVSNLSVTQRELKTATIKIRYITRADFSNNIFSMNTYNIFKITENSDSTPITYFQLDHAFKNFKDRL